jgi:hypothetical protein
LKAKKPKTKTVKGDRADEEPDFGGPFTHECGLLFLLLTLDLRKWRGLPYLSMAISTSTNKVVLKSSHIPPSHMNEPLRFIRNFTIGYWAKPI